MSVKIIPLETKMMACVEMSARVPKRSSKAVKVRTSRPFSSGADNAKTRGPVTGKWKESVGTHPSDVLSSELLNVLTSLQVPLS
jgi:hypothetical protein